MQIHPTGLFGINWPGASLLRAVAAANMETAASASKTKFFNSQGNMMNIKIKTVFAIAVTAFLAACGGGGGGGGGSTTAATTTAAVAEGVWNGTSSAGYALNILVLENGDSYTMFGTVSSGVLHVVGFDQGSGTVTGNTFAGTLKEYVYTGVTYTGNLSATVVTGVSLNGNATYSSGTSTTFTSAPPSASTYSYNTGAAITDVSGSWSGFMLDGTAATVAINSSGAITGTNSGCTFTGTAAPRPSLKNVFNVSINFGPAPCLLPNQAASGIAMDYMLTSGAKQLLVAVQDTTKAHGTMFIAQR